MAVGFGPPSQCLLSCLFFFFSFCAEIKADKRKEQGRAEESTAVSLCALESKNQWESV